ncbi:hypothetical protein BDA99DRAFT_495066 [Phascolomyces articulosus]|uniref:NmrA-like domain-containing protein n=1 Tax=Phascolomyces articulosus TaxID=60185 RepID=A0AAD5PIW6_9FUNG|nr:hypothetical protein BDA99DRAFT_495066 [Phascolomyces articulosus]
MGNFTEKETNTKERIYVVGGTGNLGSLVVQELVKSGNSITVYARSPQKVQQHDAITVVQGDYSDLIPLKKSIPGHTRLFLMVGEVSNIRDVVVAISKIAYAADIQQIVEISVKRLPWRKFLITDGHIEAEKIVYALPERQKNNNNGVTTTKSFVSLRPTNFMSNVVVYYLDSIKNENTLIDTADPNEPQEWTSNTDIAEVAAKILRDPTEKHQDAAYGLVSDIKTPLERVEILSKVLGRTITYKQVSAQEMYDKFVKTDGMDHATAYYLASYQDVDPVTRGLPILLGRAPETFETWVIKNKNLFL